MRLVINLRTDVQPDLMSPESAAPPAVHKRKCNIIMDIIAVALQDSQLPQKYKGIASRLVRNCRVPYMYSSEAGTDRGWLDCWKRLGEGALEMDELLVSPVKECNHCSLFFLADMLVSAFLHQQYRASSSSNSCLTSFNCVNSFLN